MRSPTSLTRSGYGRWPVVHQFLEVSAARNCALTPTPQDNAASSSASLLAPAELVRG